MKKLIAFLLAVAMLIALAGCAGSPASVAEEPAAAPAEEQQPAETAEETEEAEEAPAEEPAEESGPVYGGTMTICTNDIPTYFDAAIGAGYGVNLLYYDSLWMMDWGINDPEIAPFNSTANKYYNMKGQVAESWDDLETFMANGYLDVTIRGDVYFQEKDSDYDVFHGRQLTAEDVAYSYNRLLGSNGVPQVVCETDWASQLPMLNKEKAAEALDDTTVRFYFDSVTESALDVFICRQIFLTGPEWDALSPDQQLDWHYACGTGAFILTDFVADNYMSYTRNDNYFACDERYPDNKLPYLDGVKIERLVDPATITSQFIAGELDWFENAKAGLSASELAQVRASSSCVEQQLPSGQGVGITFKCSQEPWNNETVRAALQKAINLEEVYHDFYGKDDEMTIPGVWFNAACPDWVSYSQWPDELREEYAYDPDAANQMLDDAGYPVGSDGIRFSMTALTNEESYQLLLVLIQSYLAEVGVDLQVQPAADPMEVFANRTDRENPVLCVGRAGETEELSMVTVFLLPGGPLYAIQDEGSDASAKFTELFNELSSAAYLDEQKEYALEMDELFAAQHWMLIIAPFTTASQFYNTRVHGYNSEAMKTQVMLARLWVE